LNTAERLEEMQSRLQAQLQPVSMEVIDEGHMHVGHAGAKDGRGHFRLRIVSARFTGQSMMQCHRVIYGIMGELMQTDIHALAIEASAPQSD
jgi:BolA protein